MKSLDRSQKRSLNRDSRRKRLVEITFENYAILDRLRGQTSCYSLKEWRKDRKRNEQMLRNICEYPYRLGRERRSAKVLRPVHSRSIVVYKQQVTLNSQSFLIEIQRRPHYVSISALDAENQVSHSLTLSEDEALEMMESRGYARLVDYLSFVSGELRLADTPVPRTASHPPLKQERSLPYLHTPSALRYARKTEESSENRRRPKFSP